MFRVYGCCSGPSPSALTAGSYLRGLHHRWIPHTRADCLVKTPCASGQVHAPVLSEAWVGQGPEGSMEPGPVPLSPKTKAADLQQPAARHRTLFDPGDWAEERESSAGQHDASSDVPTAGSAHSHAPHHISNGASGSVPASGGFSPAKAAASTLTRKIKACQTWEGLAQVYASQHTEMDFIHFSACLTHLAKLVGSGCVGDPGSDPRHQASSQQPVHDRSAGSQHTDHDPGGPGPGQESDQLHAAPRHAWDHLQHQLLAQLCGAQAQLRPREAANVAWALARLGAPPGAAEPSRLLQLAWRLAGGMNAQEVCNTLYATAALGVQPPAAAARELLARLHAVAVAGEAEPQGLANVVWALGRLRVRPHPDTLKALLRASYQHLYTMPPEGLTQLAYGLAGLRVRMPLAWRDRLLDAAWQRMPSNDLQPQPPLPAATTRQGGHPPGQEISGRQADDVAGGARSSAQAQGALFSASSLAKLLWALVRDGRPPPHAWLTACLAEVEAQAGSLVLPDAANILWALAQMGVQPPLPLLGALMGVVYDHLREAPPPALAGIAWSLATLGARPSPQWAERFLRAAFKSAERQSVQGVATILWALATWGLRPNAKFVHGMLAGVRPQLALQGNQEDLTQLCWALPRLQHPLPDWAHTDLRALAESQLPHVDSSEAQQAVLEQLQQLGVDTQGLEQLLGAGMEQTGDLSASG